jgi:phosphotransferase system HPr (HPr) family protein
MGVMMLAAEKGTQLEIEANGSDEAQVIDDLLKVIEGGFGEEI